MANFYVFLSFPESLLTAIIVFKAWKCQNLEQAKMVLNNFVFLAIKRRVLVKD